MNIAPASDPIATRTKPSEVDAPTLGVRLRIRSLLERELDASRVEAHRQVERLFGKGDKTPGDTPVRLALLERALARSVVARAFDVLGPDGTSAPFAPKVEGLGEWTPDVIDALVRLYEEHLERAAGALRPDPALAAQTVEAVLAADEGAESLAEYDARGCAVIARAMANELRALLESADPIADLGALRERVEARRKPIAPEPIARASETGGEA